ncbi:MAG: electron transfer flavoprotein, partial [Actinobacteria bacterium]|nr:electron transfer flavoprotein [Actinomycetota bacterium]NIW32948.1 electron transfer flavoprotein [Actinomycetota bacterium]
MLVPSKHQPAFPVDRFLVREQPGDEAIPLDVLFVGGGPAGLAGAIRLAQRVAQDNETGGGLGEIEIGVLEKAEALGEHSLSGAVIRPEPFRTLFPDLPDDQFPFRGAVNS